MHSFARLEGNFQFQMIDRDALGSCADQVHFDSPEAAVENGPVLKLVESKALIEITTDAF